MVYSASQPGLPRAGGVFLVWACFIQAYRTHDADHCTMLVVLGVVLGNTYMEHR